MTNLTATRDDIREISAYKRARELINMITILAYITAAIVPFAGLVIAIAAKRNFATLGAPIIIQGLIIGAFIAISAYLNSTFLQAILDIADANLAKLDGWEPISQQNSTRTHQPEDC